MAVDRSKRRIRFRGIARSLWIGIAALAAVMLGIAWFDPPQEGFAAYARTTIGTLVVCFVAAPFVASALVAMAAWLTNSEPPDKD